MFSDRLRSGPSILGSVLWGFTYCGIFSIIMQLRLSCNVILNQMYFSDCCKCFGQHLTYLQAFQGHVRASSGLYQADWYILQYVFYWGYITM